jgi:hypothetical protein
MMTSPSRHAVVPTRHVPPKLKNWKSSTHVSVVSGLSVAAHLLLKLLRFRHLFLCGKSVPSIPTRHRLRQGCSCLYSIGSTWADRR